MTHSFSKCAKVRKFVGMLILPNLSNSHSHALEMVKRIAFRTSFLLEGKERSFAQNGSHSSFV